MAWLSEDTEGLCLPELHLLQRKWLFLEAALLHIMYHICFSVLPLPWRSCWPHDNSDKQWLTFFLWVNSFFMIVLYHFGVQLFGQKNWKWPMREAYGICFCHICVYSTRRPENDKSPAYGELNIPSKEQTTFIFSVSPSQLVLWRLNSTYLKKKPHNITHWSLS